MYTSLHLVLPLCVNTTTILVVYLLKPLHFGIGLCNLIKMAIMLMFNFHFGSVGP